MNKSFELSRDTIKIRDFLLTLKIGEQVSFANASRSVGFSFNASSSAYQSAKRIVERDHGLYIGSLRGVGFFRGSGEDMADSLEPLALRMKRTAKKSLARADLAIANNLPEHKHAVVMERRTRASLIYTTSAANLPRSNRKKPEPAQEAAPVKFSERLRATK